MWLVFVPMVFGAIRWLQIPFERQARAYGPLAVMTAIVFGIALLSLYVAILYRVTSRFVRQRSRERNRECIECGYSLIGLPEPRCPECGSAFEPEQPGEADTTETEAIAEEAEHALGGAAPDSTEQPPAEFFVPKWLLVAPIVVAVSVGIVIYQRSCGQWGGDPIFNIVLAVAAIGALLVCGLMLRHVAPRSPLQGSADLNLCSHCGQDLTGLSEPRCPACGQPRPGGAAL